MVTARLLAAALGGLGCFSSPGSFAVPVRRNANLDFAAGRGRSCLGVTGRGGQA